MNGLNALVLRGTWEVVCKESIPNDPNIMNGPIVFVIKEEGTNNAIWKALFVVQRYRDKLKTSLLKNAATTKQNSVKTLIGVGKISGSQLF